MAELDFTHIKEVALTIKTLQTNVASQVFNDLLIHSKMLADNSAEVVKMVAKLGWIELAVQFKNSIRVSLVSARDVMNQKDKEKITALATALQNAGANVVEIIKQIKEYQTTQQ